MFETIMMRISPKLMSDTKPQFQEVQRTPSSINTKEKRLKFIESFSLSPVIFLIVVELIYNVVLVSGVQESESIIYLSIYLYLSIYPSLAQRLKHLPPMQETWVRSLGQEDPLEKEMATHSSILAWRIPWAEEPGRLQSTGSQRVRHD